MTAFWDASWHACRRRAQAWRKASVALGHRLCLSLCLSLSAAPAAAALSAPSDAAPAPRAAAAKVAGKTATQDASEAPKAAVDYMADSPPPTAYDRLGGPSGPALAPESLGLVRQLGKTVLALAATLALVYLAIRLLLPAVVARLSPRTTQTLRLRERLALDGKNSLVVVEHVDGRTWLLGCGEAGIVHLERTPAPNGGPVATTAPDNSSFADALSQSRHRSQPQSQSQPLPDKAQD